MVYRIASAESLAQRPRLNDTPLDLFFLDDQKMLPLGRRLSPYDVDDFTRCVLGVYVGFVPPSYLSVTLCLKRAFTPKVSIREEYPEIRSDWPAYGVIRELCVDQALEFYSDASNKHAMDWALRFTMHRANRRVLRLFLNNAGKLV